MKKIYLIPAIPFVLGAICFFVYTIIGAHVATDGTLIEPFFLIPIGWLFIILGIFLGIIVNIWLWCQKKLDTAQKIITVAGGIILVCFGIYITLGVSRNINNKNKAMVVIENKIVAPPTDSTIASAKDTTYIIDDQTITLVNGLSEISIPDSASKQTTKYFGNEAAGDLNGDGTMDTAFLLTQDGGGSGTFYYVAVALATDKGYQGTNAILLGDRIAPQTTEISNGKITVNYADRKADESFAVSPSVGVSKHLQVLDNKLVEVK